MLASSLSMSTMGHAGGIPVIDVASIAQQVQQVAAWAKQYTQMAAQIQNLQDQLKRANGVRGMAGMANNPLSRQYLPADYQTILRDGVGQWSAIRRAAQKFEIGATSLSAASDAAQAFESVAKQAAINRASAEEGYNSASQRFADIQVLLDKVNDAPDAKDMADLQGRIQAESVMMQNEANKLQMLQFLAQSQRDLQTQQAVEISMKSTRLGVPAGW
jgi:type IV secretion system protein VirB5